MKFIFANDGTAVNVNHIVTIYVHRTSTPEGYVVRCRTTLSHAEYAADGAVLNLSSKLSDEATAQNFLDIIVKEMLDPRPTSHPDPDFDPSA